MTRSSRQGKMMPNALTHHLSHPQPLLLLHLLLHKLLTVRGHFCPLLARSLGIWVDGVRRGLWRGGVVTSARDNEKGRLSTCDNRPNRSGREALVVNHDRPLNSYGACSASEMRRCHRTPRLCVAEPQTQRLAQNIQQPHRPRILAEEWRVLRRGDSIDCTLPRAYRLGHLRPPDCPPQIAKSTLT